MKKLLYLKNMWEEKKNKKKEVCGKREYEKDLGFGGTMASWLYRAEEMLDSNISTYYHIVQNY